MANPFLGEIRIFAGNFAPVSWAFCDGRLLPIAQYDALFALLGTTYGGDGTTTFALPDLRGRIPIHQETSPQGNFVIGQLSGSETVTLLTGQLPVHGHAARAVAEAGNQLAPAGNFWAQSTLNQYSAASPPPSLMNPGAIGLTGDHQPHNNMMPYLAINFIIALQGIFPSRN